MINLPNVTIIAVSSIEIERTIRALQYSCRGINFGEVKFVTHEDVNPDGITIHKVPRINSSDEFSKITIYDLPKYVNTEYCILVQYDGFIVHPEQWTDEFLNYDWIGPLWTIGHNYFDKNELLSEIKSKQDNFFLIFRNANFKKYQINKFKLCT